MGVSRGGGGGGAGGLDPPPENHKYIGFLSKTYPDPLKNYKATKSKAGPPLKTLLDPCMDQCAEILA